MCIRDRHTTGGWNSQEYLKFNASEYLSGSTAADLHTNGGTVFLVWEQDYTDNGSANYDYPFVNFKASDGKGLQWGTYGATLTNWNVYVHRNGSNAYAGAVNLGYRFQGNVPQTLAITVTGSTFRAKYDNDNSSNNNYS